MRFELSTIRKPLQPSSGFFCFYLFLHFLFKSIKTQTKKRITEANELDQVATASVNFYPGKKLFLLVSCFKSVSIAPVGCICLA